VPTSHTADAKVSTVQIPCMDIGPLAYTPLPPPKKNSNSFLTVGYF